MDLDDYLRHDGLGLRESIAAGETTPIELLDLARARADQANPRINAICLRLDDDATRRAGSRLEGPFAGVPFLIKDLLQDLEGVASAEGSRALQGRRAKQTSTVVQRWLDAGLVVFGKTTTPEFGTKGVTEAAVYGPTRNPWALDRTPGGSSGGSAAAVAAGIVPVAGASDGGGSIRIPAACCGLVGLKAGRGLIPFGPVDSEPLDGIATQGVVSRSVRDSAAMLDVLAGPDPMSPYAPAVPDRSYLTALDQAPGTLRIGYTTRSSLRPAPHPEAVRAVDRAAELLTDLGHQVEEVAVPFDDAQVARDFLTIWCVHQALEIERIKAETGAPDGSFEQDTRVLAALGRVLSATELQAAQEHRRDHIAGLSRFHADHDLLLTPTLAEPPIAVGALDTPRPLQALAAGVIRARGMRVLHRSGLMDRLITPSLAWVPYTQVANITGRPAISLPLHWTPEGLPLGVQFVGPLRSEELLLRLARQLEHAAPWADRRPPLV
ncbi:amidase [Actinomycetospora atypica]|uniref:Amidase n=1 Tax=Actinomycetospora atypica TaxID=1290095 RepID=A0ABV9YL59_9PSEU